MTVAAVILDNEPVQALLDPRHRRHRRVAALLTEASGRNLRRPGAMRIIVPVAVRVEAGWDRSNPATANANRIARPVDQQLDGAAADRAVQLRHDTGVSVVDASVGHAFEVAPQPVAVLTSDVDDMARLRAVTRAAAVRIIAL